MSVSDEELKSKSKVGHVQPEHDIIQQTEERVEDQGDKGSQRRPDQDLLKDKDSNLSPCISSPKNCETLGIGLELKFSNFKILSFCFLALNLINIAKLVIFYQGQGYSKQEAGLFESFSIGNLETSKGIVDFWVFDKAYAKNLNHSVDTNKYIYK